MPPDGPKQPLRLLDLCPHLGPLETHEGAGLLHLPCVVDDMEGVEFKSVQQ